MKGKHIVGDIGRMDFPSLREMLKAIRVAASRSKQEEVWVILTNHSKYITDFSHIDRFLKDARKYNDINFVTLTTIARQIRDGRIPIKTLHETYSNKPTAGKP